MSLFGLVGFVKADTQADGKSDDDDGDEQAPPLELAAVASVLVRDGNLFVALLDVVDGLLGVLLRSGDDRFLSLDELCHLLVERGQLDERLLDALQLVVAGSNITQDGIGLACSVGFELLM